MSQTLTIIVSYEEHHDPEIGDTLEPVSAEAELVDRDDCGDFEKVELAFFDSYDPDEDAFDDFSDLFDNEPAHRRNHKAARAGWLRRLVDGLAQPA